jgi:hypothetical protein
MTGFFQPMKTLVLAASLCILAACGGSSDVNTVVMSGTVSGLTTGNLALTNGLSTVTIPSGSTTFTFPNRMNIGISYNVSVLQTPTGYTCLVGNGAGTAGYTDTTAIIVTCATNNNLGGTISGLVGSGLVLANGATTVTVAANASTFVFPSKVMAGVTYGVTVLTQPAGQFCSVTNGAATMGQTDVTSVIVTCTKA